MGEDRDAMTETMQRTPRLRRNTLTHQLIVRAALDVLDQDEPDGLTFNRLGAQLGCSPTAVYRHFPGREQLLIAVVEELTREAFEDYAPHDDWLQSLRDIAFRTWRIGLVHPAAAAVSLLSYTGGTNELKAVDAVLDAMMRGGRSGRDAVVEYQAFANFILSTTTMNAARMTTSRPIGKSAVWVQEYPPVDPAEFPSAMAVRDDLKVVDFDEVYHHQVDLYLAALSARAITRE